MSRVQSQDVWNAKWQVWSQIDLGVVPNRDRDAGQARGTRQAGRTMVDTHYCYVELRDAALTTVSAEMKWRAAFEGEFFNVIYQLRRRGRRAPCVVNFTIGPASSC
jgi:hypothetical protein